MSDPDPSTSEFPVVERRGLGPKLYDEIKHPKARKSDGGWRYWCVWLYTRTLPLVATVVAFIALAGTQSDVERQREGRRVAIDVLCGFGNGVSEAGRKALAGELQGQSGNGLSQRSQRDYVRTITSSLLAEAGFDAREVTRPDGQVDCAALRKAAQTTGG